MNQPTSTEKPVHFIKQHINRDLSEGKNQGRVHTRFPPEPNGYLHIGHAKSICLNFGLAQEYPNAQCNLRFDDTNPTKEEVEYVESIQQDVRWLGFDWEDRLFFASDYFEQLYRFAEELITNGLAFVCDLNGEQIRSQRGTLTEPGINSPFRDRSVEENLDLFRQMRAGAFPDGSRTLRAKIDMASPIICMRDPVLYRIMHTAHHRTGSKWCIYPMYDFTHCISDAIEGITHSLCTLEFQDNRPLYEWILNHISSPSMPRQIEFARLNLNYTVMSKRKLLHLVQSGAVHGWDDPRMPTLAGLRRRGYTSAAIRTFCDKIGMAKADSVVDIALLEHCLRDDLNQTAFRAMAVLDPIKLVIESFPEHETLWLKAENNPEDPTASEREIPFTREVWIERSDFMVDAPKKYFRLAPGREVRLKHAFYVTCDRFETDDQGNITTVFARHDPATRGGWSEDGRKVKGTIHWISVPHAKKAEIRLYDHLFTVENPGAVEDVLSVLNPASETVIEDAYVEPSLAEAGKGSLFQFLRHGYFCRDHYSENLVFHRSVALKDSWAKTQAKE
jgi:glutaminyl-tRNA synthetase